MCNTCSRESYDPDVSLTMEIQDVAYVKYVTGYHFLKLLIRTMYCLKLKSCVRDQNNFLGQMFILTQELNLCTR